VRERESRNGSRVIESNIVEAWSSSKKEVLPIQIKAWSVFLVKIHAETVNNLAFS